MKSSHIFSNLKRKKQLDIIKYNKNMKKRININIKDYKEYSEIFSPIVFEIKPVTNDYGKFININLKDDIYFHIFLNNNKIILQMIQLHNLLLF